MASKIFLNKHFETANQIKLHSEMMQKVKSMAASEKTSAQHTNADKLCFLIGNVYVIYQQTKAMFAEFCEREKCDVSSKLKQVTANGQIEETSAAVNDYVKEVFGENHGFTSPKAVVWKNENVSIAELLEEIKEQISDYIAQGAERLGCKVMQKKVQLTYIEKETNQIRVADSSHVDCLIYALYQLNEAKAEDSIFHKKPFFTGPMNGQKLEVLMDQCGFRLVDNAQLGDFIIYLNKDGLLCHGGVLINTNMVQSKWGTHDEVIEHPIQCVPESYRHGYILLRKDGATLGKPWVR